MIKHHVDVRKKKFEVYLRLIDSKLSSRAPYILNSIKQKRYRYFFYDIYHNFVGGEKNDGERNQKRNNDNNNSTWPTNCPPKTFPNFGASGKVIPWNKFASRESKKMKETESAILAAFHRQRRQCHE